MTCRSSRPLPLERGARPKAGSGPRGRLPAGLAAALCLTAAVGGCAAPAVVTPALPASRPLRVIDAGGVLEGREARAAVDRLIRREGGSALLAHHLRDVEGAVSGPLVLGNRAHLLIDGPRTYDAMLQAIAEARHNVHLQTYILEAGELGNRLAALLEAKRAEGVSIKVLYDGVGSMGTPAEYFGRLRAAGVQVCEFNPVNPLKAESGWEINNRGHRKLLVVDGRVAFTGGVNISSVYASSSFGGSGAKPRRDDGWRDTHVEVRGPVVAQIQRLFLDAWAQQDCPAGGDPATWYPQLRREGTQAMRVVAADPRVARSELYVALLSVLSRARERAWLTYGYFVPDRRILDALEGAAARGVDVRLVLPGFSDFWAPLYAGRSRYAELLAAGVRIFERRDALLHAKTAVIDGVWSTVGSTNLDWRSLVHNYEADVLVLDDGFGAEMEGLFRLDERTSHELSAEEWRRRGLRSRLLEGLARAWEYLL